MELVFANNAISSLAGSIANTATTCQLQAGTGILFPQPASGQYFVCTFTDAATGLLNEIVHCTQVTGDTLTIQRGQEDTAPQAWSANDLCAELWTAGQARQMLQQGQSQFQTSNYGVDIGVANAYRVVLNPALSAPVAGMPIRVKISNTNTGPSTLDPGPGAAPIVSVLGLPLTGGELTVGMVEEFFWNGASYNLLQPTVQGVPTGAMAPFAGNVAPGGWLRCDGQPVSRTVYAALFTVIGIAYGSGDGVNTFNIPDMRGRVAAHLDGGTGRLPGFNTLGVGGGNYQNTAYSVVPQLGVNVSGNISGATSGSLQTHQWGNTGDDPGLVWVSGNTIQGAVHPHQHYVDIWGNTGGALSVYGTFSGTGATPSAVGVTSSAFNIVQPTLMTNYIIKA